MVYVNAFYRSGLDTVSIAKLFSAQTGIGGKMAAGAAQGAAAGLPALKSSSPLANTTSNAIAAIQALVKGEMPSAAVGGAYGANAGGLTADQEDTLRRVREWIKSGAVDDAASGKDSPWLQEMAKEGKLGPSMASWTPEFDKQLSLPEKRVWAEARMLQGIYGDSPKNISEAQKKWTAEQLQILPQLIQQELADKASGCLSAEQIRDGQKGLEIRISELRALQEGRVKLEKADPSIKYNVTYSFIRDASGVVVGGSSHEQIDQRAYLKIYGNNSQEDAQWHDIGYSPYFGGFIATWDK